MENVKPHTVSSRKRESLVRRYCDFSNLRTLFTQQISSTQTDLEVLSESKDVAHLRSAKKKDRTRTKSADFSVLMDKQDSDAASDVDPYESVGFDDDSFLSFTSDDSKMDSLERKTADSPIASSVNLRRMLVPNTSMDLGVLSRSFQDLNDISMPDTDRTAVKNSERPCGMKSSKSCESLPIYENVDQVNPDVPRLVVDKKSLRTTVSHSVLTKQKSLPMPNFLVSQLVRRYEALSPRSSSSDMRSMKALSFVEKMPPREKVAKTSSLDCGDGCVGSSSWKTRSFSTADAPTEPLYETACTYETVSGYESVPNQGNLASFLAKNAAVATVEI